MTERRPRFDVSRFELAVVGGLSAIVFTLIFLATYDSRHITIDSTCASKLQNIRVALRMYQNDYGTLPPAVVYDSQGRPAHSWRVLILPYLGRADIYRRYWFSEPWNSERNRALTREIPREYRCPADDPAAVNDTSYLAVTGEGSLWDQGSESRATDDDRVVIAEVRRSGIAWTEPRDLDLESLETPSSELAAHLTTQHAHPARFATLRRLLLLDERECPDCANLLHELATDGQAVERIRGRVKQQTQPAAVPDRY